VRYVAVLNELYAPPILFCTTDTPCTFCFPGTMYQGAMCYSSTALAAFCKYSGEKRA
jgi:hypothetical protein